MGHPSGSIELEPIEAPPWVPPDVVFWARLLLASVKEDYPDTAPIIRSLVSDPRMKTVWRELGKRNSPGTLGRFFGSVVSLLWTAPPVVSRRQLDAFREPLRARAHSMRVMTAELRAYGVNEERAISCANYLAAKWQELANNYPLPDSHPWLSGIIVDRPGDARTRGFLIGLVRLSKASFGKANYRSMAAIASIALDLEITERRIRYAANRQPL